MIVNIVCELLPREYENAILLQAELTKRGHKVNLYKKDEDIAFNRCDVLLIPNGYNSRDYEWYCKLYGGVNANVISLQYEQVFTKKDEDSKYLVPSGKAKNAKWLCWGKRPYHRMLENGIDESQLTIVGSIQMDCLRDEFKSYWLTKEKLADIYKIDKKKTWMLFISSFAYVENDFMKDALDKTFGEHSYDNFCDISERSQRMLLDWFEKYIIMNPDVCLIYRPHPIEANSVALKRLVEKYPKAFYVISDLSVKQWIIVSDVILTWYSTSIAECYKAKKNAIILRPVNIPEYEDVTMFIGAKIVTSFDDMVTSICNYKNSDFPIEEKMITAYYESFEKPTYKMIADYVEENNTKLYIQNYDGLIKNIVFKYFTGLKFLLKKLYIQWYYLTSCAITNKRLRKKLNLSGLEVRAMTLHKVDYKEQKNILTKIVNEID